MVQMLFGLLGGLALFIYGMTEMGHGLQRAAGARLKKILSSLTSVPILGVLVGTAVTAVIQSSSATTVMVVGFVNSSLMTLKQAIPVIMGSNIGTTITAQIVALDITKYYMGMLGIGFILYFIFKKSWVKSFGYLLFAFGLLFMGMDLMSTSMQPLAESSAFSNAMVTLAGHEFLTLLVGLCFTALIQSSSAALGILIAMANAGLVTLDMAIPAILGFNIGTCITCVLASIGSKVNARRTAAAHVIFNITGALIFLLLLPVFKEMVLFFTPDGSSVAHAIANAHTIFNIITTIILLPFIKILERLVTKLIPGEDISVKMAPVYLDERVLYDANIALDLALRELVRMAELAKDNVDKAYDFFLERDSSVWDEIEEQEQVVDILECQITDYIIKIPQSGLGKRDLRIRGDIFHISNDIERISDHAVNIKECGENCMTEDFYFSSVAMKDLAEIYGVVENNIRLTLEALRDKDKVKATQALVHEDLIDELEERFRKSHIERLEEGSCSASVGVIYLDILSNFERIGDHCNNIATMVKEDF